MAVEGAQQRLKIEM